MSALPFLFAYVDETDTHYIPAFERVDEDIVRFERKLEEGQFPTLDITIRNPRVGLLASGRKVWAWLAYQDPSGNVTPIFFGILVGLPNDLFKELVSLRFEARSSDYIQQKQAVAETLKVRPYWDPVALDDRHRDDPDSILEGWSALYQVDPVTLAVSASDVLIGEDGAVLFTEDDAFYQSVGMTIGQAPLANVLVQVTTKWTQRCVGTVPGPNVNVVSYTGSTFKGEWPKPGANLGGGWKVEASFVNDVFQTELTPSVSSSWSYTNKSANWSDGDTDSASGSQSGPALLNLGTELIYTMTIQVQNGVCNPYSDPPINTPSSLDVTGIIVPQWTLNCTWTLRYEAQREYTELLFFNVIANTQPVLAEPTVEQDTQTITINCVDVGVPLEQVEAWSDFAGQPVAVSQIIFPNNPTTPGGLSYQVCTQAGTAGNTEPIFSDVPGTQTIDGTVVWSSMGPTPLTTQPNWSDSTSQPRGLIINNVPKKFNITTGDWEDDVDNQAFLLCNGPGTTNGVTQSFTYQPPATTNTDFPAALVTVFFIPGPGWTWPGHTSGYQFSNGVYINDGTVTWTYLGQTPGELLIPIGGTMTRVLANNYFPSDRGQWTTEYAIMRARALMRMRARSVTVKWSCPIDKVLGLTCRMNATLNDPRLPGGTATGKIIGCSITADGSTGAIRGHVTTGVAVGRGGSLHANPGDPEYVNTDYVDDSYQVFDGQTIIPDFAVGDIYYSPIAYKAFDDGLQFPLTVLPINGKGSISGSAAAQKARIDAAAPITAAIAAQAFNESLTNTVVGQDSTVTRQGVSPQQAWADIQQNITTYAQQVPYVMAANPVRFDIFLKSVTNGPFNGAYNLSTSLLEIPKGIDLSASSHP